MFQTFLHMHVYCLNIQLFFLFFFSLWNRWIWILNDAVSNSILPRNDLTNQRSVFCSICHKVLTVHFLEEWKTRFYLRFNKSSKWWMTIRKIDFSQEKYSIWIFFRMTHFWDESSELVLNHFSRRESRSEYWETYQVHREIQFYTDINLLKGETGIT